MGNCAVCKRYKELTPTTYLDDDQIRQTNLFCAICRNRAKVAGVLKNE